MVPRIGESLRQQVTRQGGEIIPANRLIMINAHKKVTVSSAIYSIG
jgi:hypothetical protein